MYCFFILRTSHNKKVKQKKKLKIEEKENVPIEKSNFFFVFKLKYKNIPKFCKSKCIFCVGVEKEMYLQT